MAVGEDVCNASPSTLGLERGNLLPGSTRVVLPSGNNHSLCESTSHKCCSEVYTEAAVGGWRSFQPSGRDWGAIGVCF